MPRSLRQNSSNSKIKNEEEKLNGEQKKQFENLKNVAKRYEGKSESEILSDLTGAVEKGRRDGSLTDEKLNGIINTVAPLLNGEQKQKLQKVINALKNNQNE